LYRFFGLKWFGQTNPSGLLINVLNFSILVSKTPRYSTFCPFYGSREYAISRSNIYFISNIFRIRSYSYRVFAEYSIYVQIHSAYSRQCAQKISNTRNIIIFFTAFEGTLLKTRIYVQLESDPPGKLIHSRLPNRIVSAYMLIIS
jgi:hypothetical protein